MTTGLQCGIGICREDIDIMLTPVARDLTQKMQKTISFFIHGTKSSIYKGCRKIALGILKSVGEDQ